MPVRVEAGCVKEDTSHVGQDRSVHGNAGGVAQRAVGAVGGYDVPGRLRGGRPPWRLERERAGVEVGSPTAAEVDQGLVVERFPQGRHEQVLTDVGDQERTVPLNFGKPIRFGEQVDLAQRSGADVGAPPDHVHRVDGRGHRLERTDQLG